MPRIYDYYCMNEMCDFSGATEWGYYMYADADDGERAKSREVIGEDATAKEVDSRIGFN